MKDIRVEGTVQTTADDIRQASGIQDSDYTINLLLDKAKYEERIKSNYWVESAQLVYQFPTKFTIKVKEYDIVAYYVMEAEEKAKKEAEEAEKKQEEERKRLEEEKKKQEEESNRNQTSQRSSRR